MGLECSHSKESDEWGRKGELGAVGGEVGEVPGAGRGTHGGLPALALDPGGNRWGMCEESYV